MSYESSTYAVAIPHNRPSELQQRPAGQIRLEPTDVSTELKLNHCALPETEQNGSLELGPVISSRRNVANSAHFQTCLFSAGAHDNHTTPCYTPTKKLPTAQLTMRLIDCIFPRVTNGYGTGYRTLRPEQAQE